MKCARCWLLICGLVLWGLASPGQTQVTPPVGDGPQTLPGVPRVRRSPIRSHGGEEVPAAPSDDGPGTFPMKLQSTCLLGDRPLIPLVPVVEIQSGRLTLKRQMGLTVDPHPSVLVYLPDNQATQAIFQIQTLGGEIHYETTLTLPMESGIIQLDFPTDPAYALKVETVYRWSLTLNCALDQPEEGVMVRGLVQRVIVPGLAERLVRADPQEHPSLYAEAGLWYDTLRSLVKLRQANPQDSSLIEAWSSLLESVKLPELATEPLVPLPDQPMD